jgi:hypothetical protein
MIGSETSPQHISSRARLATASETPQSVDKVRVGNEEVGARRRLAPTGSTLRVKPDGAQGRSPCAHTSPPVVIDGLGCLPFTFLRAFAL